LFRESTAIVNIGSGNNSNTVQNNNLTPNTSYTFYLRNGSDSGSPLLAYDTCTTFPSPVQPIHGVCGSRATHYSHSETSWPAGTFCSVGNASPSNPLFPAQNSTVTWICQGINGGQNASCSATRGTAPNVWGNISCDETTLNSITVRYSYANGSNVSLFRGESRLDTWSESQRTDRIYNDTGLSSNTSYTYYLRNGTSSSSTPLAHVTCRTDQTVSDPRIAITKNVRNVSRNTGWANSVEATPGQTLSFRIEVRSTGSSRLENVIVKDFMPDKLDYVGNLTVNGVATQGNILQGLNIGSIPAGTVKTVIFDVRVKTEDQFGIGWTNLVNRAQASAGDISDVQDTAEIYISRGFVAGAATRIPTGITNNKLIDFVLLPLILTLIIWALFKKNLIALSEWLERKKLYAADSKAKRSLTKVASAIRAKENIV
jgi:uncharacterized repeat protein (TIGR01451 family)